MHAGAATVKGAGRKDRGQGATTKRRNDAYIHTDDGELAGLDERLDVGVRFEGVDLCCVFL